VLAAYQFDVLMGDAQLLGVSKQRDLMRRIGGESPEVREKSRPPTVKTGFEECTQISTLDR